MRIAMRRGDIKLVRFLVEDPERTTTEIDFTEIYFTVKRNTKEKLYMFQKKLSTGGIVKLGQGDYEVKIEPSDTAAMVYGNYKFDIQLEYLDELKETFVGDFVLKDEVTFDDNE